MRRLLYLPHSEAAEEEVRAARERGHGAHRLAFVEAVFNFEQGLYRFDAKHVASLSALLLRAARGPAPSPAAAAAAAAHDTPAALALLAHTLCPPYATSDACDSHPLQAHGLQPMPDAPTALQLGALIRAELGALSPTLSVLAAEEAFMRLARDNPCYGAEMFQAQRVWEVVDELAEEGAPPEERVEEVLLCIGHAGATVISQSQPLEAQLMVPFEDITHFASDGSLFLMNVLEPSLAGGGKVETMVYILSPAAEEINAAVERYVHARAAWEEVGGVHGASTLPVPPRSARTVGALPVLTQIVVAQRPEWAAVGGEGSGGGGGGGGGGGSGSGSGSGAPADPFDAASAGLPPGWVAASDSDGDIFYYHTLTKATTWDHPGQPTGPLAEGWCEVADPLDARRYFFCPATRAVTWTRPGAAAGWGGGGSGSSSSRGLEAGGGGGGGGGGSPLAVTYSSLRQTQQAGSPQHAGGSWQGAGGGSWQGAGGGSWQGAGGGGGGGGGGGADAAAIAVKERQLPQGWSLAIDSSDGSPYYFTTSGRTQWELPLFPAT